VQVVEPFGARVGVAAATAGADSDRRDTVTDRDVRVGRCEGEIGLASDETRGLERRLDERVVGRRLSARTSADRFDLDAEHARTDGASVVLIVGGALREDADRALDVVERGGRRRP
jgi:hypothetical protein